MKKNLQTKFNTRQYMLSRDFEIYYYDEHYQSKVESHTHNYYEFYFFLEGDMILEIEDRQYRLNYGDVVLLPPGIAHHAIVCDKSQPYRRFVFWISREYCSQLLTLSEDYGYVMRYVMERREYIFHNDVLAFSGIQTKIFHLLEEIHGNRFGKETRLTLCVRDLLLHLNRIVYEQKHPKSEKEEQKLYEGLLNYIEENLGEELTLDILAREFFVSKYHVAHVFKDNMGIPVHKYVMKKRLSVCKDAILNNIKVTEACRMCGFSDYSGFYRAFKKEYGISPKECKELGVLNSIKPDFSN